jgi:hypothetical protein
MKVDQKFLEVFEMRCRRNIEKINMADRVRNSVLHRVKDERNIVHIINRKKAKWICHILGMYCLLKYVIVGETQGPRRQGRRGKQRLDTTRKTENTRN